MTTNQEIQAIAARLAELCHTDNDAPRLIVDHLADLLTTHGWRDPDKASEKDNEMHDMTIECDEKQDTIDQMKRTETKLTATVEAQDQTLERLKAERDKLQDERDFAMAHADRLSKKFFGDTSTPETETVD